MQTIQIKCEQIKDEYHEMYKMADEQNVHRQLSDDKKKSRKNTNECSDEIS